VLPLLNLALQFLCHAPEQWSAARAPRGRRAAARFAARRIENALQKAAIAEPELGHAGAASAPDCGIDQPVGRLDYPLADCRLGPGF
jgi:hypothetical protein